MLDDASSYEGGRGPVSSTSSNGCVGGGESGCVGALTRYGITLPCCNGLSATPRGNGT